MKLSEINTLKKTEFCREFGNIVECYPAIAEKLYETLPFRNIQDIIEKTHENLEELQIEEKFKILRLHPDLAGKLADENKLTAESTEEQKAAGLHNLTKEVKKELNNLNEKYKKRFGFPFVICARENKIVGILNGLQSRLDNGWEEELEIAIKEVKKISKLRIEDIVSE